MAVKNKNVATGLTVAKQKAADQWLENAAVSASSESEQAIQAKNVLRIIKLQEDLIKHSDDLVKRQRSLIKALEDHIKRLNDSITHAAA